jgi:hypothetical protein
MAHQFVIDRLPSWPEQLDAAAAASFCGESLATFRRKVAERIYPAATFRRRGCRPMWHRRVLQEHLACIHGLAQAERDDIAELV